MNEQRLDDIEERLGQLRELPPGGWVRWAGHPEVYIGPLSTNTPGRIAGHRGQVLVVSADLLGVEDPEAAVDAALAVADFCAHARADVSELLEEVRAARTNEARMATAQALLSSCVEHLSGIHGRVDGARLRYVLGALAAAQEQLGSPGRERPTWREVGEGVEVEELEGQALRARIPLEAEPEQAAEVLSREGLRPHEGGGWVGEDGMQATALAVSAPAEERRSDTY